MLPQSVPLLKLMFWVRFFFFFTSDIQDRELCGCDFMKYIFSIVMFQDAHELICFKHGMMLSTTKL